MAALALASLPYLLSRVPAYHVIFGFSFNY